MAIESGGYRRIDVHINVAETNPAVPVRVITLFNRKFRRDLHGRPLASAHPFENVYRKIASDFVDAGSVPVAQLAVFVEERNFAPFAFIGDEVRALDWPRSFEDPPQIGLPKTSEDAAQLIEKLRAVVARIQRRNLALALRESRQADAQCEGQAKLKESFHRRYGYRF